MDDTWFMSIFTCLPCSIKPFVTFPYRQLTLVHVTILVCFKNIKKKKKLESETCFLTSLFEADMFLIIEVTHIYSYCYTDKVESICFCMFFHPNLYDSKFLNS